MHQADGAGTRRAPRPAGAGRPATARRHQPVAAPHPDLLRWNTARASVPVRTPAPEGAPRAVRGSTDVRRRLTGAERARRPGRRRTGRGPARARRTRRGLPAVGVHHRAQGTGWARRMSTTSCRRPCCAPLRELRTLRTPESFRPWLATIATRQISTHLRRRQAELRRTGVPRRGGRSAGRRGGKPGVAARGAVRSPPAGGARQSVARPRRPGAAVAVVAGDRRPADPDRTRGGAGSERGPRRRARPADAQPAGAEPVARRRAGSPSAVRTAHRRRWRTGTACRAHCGASASRGTPGRARSAPAPPTECRRWNG